MSAVMHVPLRRRSHGLSSLLILALMACASTRGQSCRDRDDATTSQPTTDPTTSPTTDPTGPGTGGSIDDTEVADLDRAMSDVLREVYDKAERTAWKQEGGPGGLVFTLEYGLGRAHARSAKDGLLAGMGRRGFTVDRTLDDEAVTTVFASRNGLPVIVTVDVGATICAVTVDRGGP